MSHSQLRRDADTLEIPYALLAGLALGATLFLVVATCAIPLDGTRQRAVLTAAVVIGAAGLLWRVWSVLERYRRRLPTSGD